MGSLFGKYLIKYKEHQQMENFISITLSSNKIWKLQNLKTEDNKLHLGRIYRIT